MTATTVIYIIIALIIALLVALFQYKFGSKKRLNGVYLGLIALRTLSIFAVLLLLINPKFEQFTYLNVKPNLIVAVDNSESISHLNRQVDAESFLDKIRSDDDLKDNFNIHYYTFGSELNPLDSVNFKDNKSDLAMVFDRLGDVYNSETTPTILLTDGNQTFGRDYLMASRAYKQAIFPVILGDTTVFTDLKIQQLNANRYSYLNNQFPVEAIVVYNGSKPVTSKFEIRSGGSVVFSKAMNFDGLKNSEVIGLTLPASNVGLRKYRAIITPLSEEKNKVNNYKDFAVEVINQKTNVAIVSNIIHPDLGAIKSTIESNKQRSASIINSNDFLNKITDFQMVILYQPDASFKSVFDAVNNAKLNKMIVVGAKTNFRNLNAFQTNFNQEVTNQTEDYQPILNASYSVFNIENIDFDDYPPIRSEFGSLTFAQPINPILYKSVNGIQLDEPLLATYEVGTSKEAILNGEGIWKWRAQNYRSNGNFEAFDDFFGKLVQYLSSNKPRSRLTVNFETVYRETDGILITSQYFNKGYEFDVDAQLNISIKNKETDEVKTYPLILNNNNYQIDLSGLLPPGDYDFTVVVKGENHSRSGQFTILDYNVEQQFLNADVNGLDQLATQSDGTSYFVDNTADLFDQLKEDPRFVTIQKSNKNIVPLIDWKYLLAIIALSLASEWLIRKYNGLI